jgi:hypothetical protein
MKKLLCRITRKVILDVSKIKMHLILIFINVSMFIEKRC